ncbi:MAG: nucleoside 2-deoxyribosyltransferase [Acidobacteria bacterium]|nr:nucleoside 2-deoxyribosyltransferase [Acidobacteriota bacterium]
MRDVYRHDESRQWIYVAGPLFSDGEKAFNELVDKALSDVFRVYLPQRDGLLLADLIRDGVPPDAASRQVYEEDTCALRRCDLVMIVLDGRSVDEGAAFELGFATGLGKECYAVQTDPRRLLPWGNNPMIAGAVRRVFCSLEEVAEWASTRAQFAR